MKRLTILPLITAVLLIAPVLSAQAARTSATHGERNTVERTAPAHEARGGCGSRGGPGYRKSNGQCAGWKG